MKLLAVALMIVAAAAGWHWLGWAVIPVALLVGYLAWRIDVAYRPDGRCWWCKGRGTRWFSTRVKSGPCFFCHGKTPRRRGAREAGKR